MVSLKDGRLFHSVSYAAGFVMRSSSPFNSSKISMRMAALSSSYNFRFRSCRAIRWYSPRDPGIIVLQKKLLSWRRWSNASVGQGTSKANDSLDCVLAGREMLLLRFKLIRGRSKQLSATLTGSKQAPSPPGLLSPRRVEEGKRVTQSCHRFRPRVEIDPLAIAVDRLQRIALVCGIRR